MEVLELPLSRLDIILLLSRIHCLTEFISEEFFFVQNPICTFILFLPFLSIFTQLKNALSKSKELTR